jgi:hypothetical protein
MRPPRRIFLASQPRASSVQAVLCTPGWRQHDCGQAVRLTLPDFKPYVAVTNSQV